MNTFPIERVISAMQKRVQTLDVPLLAFRAAAGDDPFRILIATVLSLRTKDETTAPAATRLFFRADSPEKMALLSVSEISELIYPVGFYNRKSQQILEICRILIETHNGAVPADMDSLLGLPGVGRKTANLVLSMGFGIPAICVDTHVHRIMNRLGYVRTKTPEETEMKLREKLPEQYWLTVNEIFVAYGQGICSPVSPWCSKCVVRDSCRRVDVVKSR